MSKPLIVNIVGLPKVGTTTLCNRVKYALDSADVPTKIVKPRCMRDVINFDDDYYADKLNAKVVIIDNHHFSTAGLTFPHRKPLFTDDNIKPDISILVTAKIGDYLTLIGANQADYRTKQHNARLIDKYLHGNRDHFGSDQLYIVKVDTDKGRLYAAGNVRRIVKDALCHHR